MKSIGLKYSILIVLLLALIASCSIEKKHYSSGYYIDWHKHNAHALNKIKNNKTITEEKTSPTIISSTNLQLNYTKYNDKKIVFASKESNKEYLKKNNHKILNYQITSDKEKAKTKSNSPLKNEFKNGVKRIIDHQKNSKYSLNGLALAGFICSLVGLILFGLVLGLLAIVLSAIGLYKIKQDPINWDGKGFAIAGIIIGFVDIIGWIIFFILIF